MNLDILKQSSAVPLGYTPFKEIKKCVLYVIYTAFAELSRHYYPFIIRTYLNVTSRTILSEHSPHICNGIKVIVHGNFIRSKIQFCNPLLSLLC